MKCEELLLALSDHVDGEVDPGVCDEFQAHLTGCNPCQVVVDNIRGTITLYKSGEPYEMPESFKQKLHATLRARWAQRFPDQGS